MLNIVMAKQQTILHIDKDVTFVQSIKNHILQKDNGYLIKSAHNGKDALEILEDEKADLVILDTKLPLMDGITLLKELRSRNVWLPVIILANTSVLAGEESRIFGEFGIVDYMEKPVNLEKLDRKLDEVLRHFEINKECSTRSELLAILRVIEDEKKTGVVNIRTGEREGWIFFKDGNIMDIETNGLSGEQALEKCLKFDNGGKKISVKYINHQKDRKLEISLSGSMPDASSRLLDENNKPVEENKMARLKNSLGILKEEITGLLTATIFGSDGLPVAIENPGNLDVDAFSAKFAMVGALVSKSVKGLSGGSVSEILVEEEKGWSLLRPIGKTGMYLFVAVTSDATLGNVRLVVRRLAAELEKPV